MSEFKSPFGSPGKLLFHHYFLFLFLFFLFWFYVNPILELGPNKGFESLPKRYQELQGRYNKLKEVVILLYFLF